MDFLKACTTNVQVIDGFSMPYRLYSLLEGDAKREAGEQARLVTALQRSGIWAAENMDGISVLGEKSTVEDQHLSGFRMVAEGLLDETTIASSTAVYEAFISALEADFTISLSKDHGAVKMGPWTWLFPGVGTEDDALVLVHLCVTYSSTVGALFVTTSAAPAELSRLDDSVTNGSTLILAPSGQMARLQRNATRAGQHATWEHVVRDTLEAEGIALTANEQWALVVPINATTSDEGLLSVPWPARLCFTSSKKTPAHTLGPLAWFSDAFKNPLTEAEDWYTSKEDRERAAEEADRKVKDAEAAQNTFPLLSGEPAESEFTTSPPFVQRMDLQNASGIYPTPPDGLVPGSTNHNTSDSVPQTQIDGGPSVEGLDNDVDARARGHSLASSAGFPLYQGHADDLFGDDADMGYGDVEVDDADFSFFDEPDEPGPPGMVPAPAQTDDEAPEDTTVATEPAESDEAKSVPVVAPDTANAVSHEAIPETPAQITQDFSTGSGNDTAMVADSKPTEESKQAPLSPFGIKERLLPPPIPASAARSEREIADRRPSTFRPVLFNDRLDIDSRYRTNGPFASVGYIERDRRGEDQTDSVIKLPPKRKKQRLKTAEEATREEKQEYSESEEDSYTDDSSASDSGLPPHLPWDSFKRKRHLDHDRLTPATDDLGSAVSEDEVADKRNSGMLSGESMRALIVRLLKADQIHGGMRHHQRLLQQCAPLPIDGNDEEERDIGSPHAATPLELGHNADFESHGSDARPIIPHTDVEVSSHQRPRRLQKPAEMFNLSKQDVIGVAQVVTDQAIHSTVESADKLNSSVGLNAIQQALKSTIKNILPSVADCDLAKLAPARDVSNKPPATKGQPRPPQRSDTMVGPDILPIPAPHVRVQRGDSHWDLLPPAIPFWEALALGPASGQKDIAWCCICPSSMDLQGLVYGFLEDLGTAYEACKLGSYGGVCQHFGKEIKTQLGADEGSVDNVIPVKVDDISFTQTVLRTYQNVCKDIGTVLGSVGDQEPGRTIVVYIISPFADNATTAHLCSCFWELYKAYKAPPKAHKSAARADLVLQILPTYLIASPDTLILPQTGPLATLAREIYDRCPPQSSLDYSSPLSILAASALELSAPHPRRINFQLKPDPPSNLLHEGSVLHLAYACSVDGLWLTAAWTDNTGRYQASVAYSLPGRCFTDVVDEVWSTTLEIMTARQASWRVVIAAPNDVDASQLLCWKTLADSTAKSGNSVVLLSIDAAPAVRLSPHSSLSTGPNGALTSGAGFLTPVSTPQASSLTVSPDASGGHGNAPPTPAPSEANLESDPDAHLVDTTDETWGVLLQPDLVSTKADPPLASGMLVKHGANPPGAGDGEDIYLPSLGVQLLHTAPLARRSDVILQDVLKMYRNLGLLAKLRGVEEKGVVPWHVVAAGRSAVALDGFT